MPFLLSLKLRVSYKTVKFCFGGLYVRWKIFAMWNQKALYFFPTALTLWSRCKKERFFVPVLIALKDTSSLSELCLLLKMLRNNRDMLERGFKEQQSQTQGVSHCKGGSLGVPEQCHRFLRNHRLVWVEKGLKDHLIPSPAMGQHPLPLDNIAPSSIQPKLEHFQG